MGSRSVNGHGRRIVVTVVLVVLIVGLMGVQGSSRGQQQADDAPRRDLDRAAAQVDEPDTVHTFLSAPDLFNGDIGDTRRAPTWRLGMPNSWNASWARNVRNVFGQLAGTGADSYLVAGDLVDGHWHRDTGGSGVFGPGRTRAQQLQRITAAGNLYYPEWLRFWRDAGVPRWRVHTAVGDHEVGDNPWPPGSLKYDGFRRFKDVYARHLTRSADGTRSRYTMRPRGTAYDDTAYATYLAPTVLLVTVDVFARDRRAVRATVDRDQLAWLERTLDEVDDDTTVIVQGHTPVLGPVRVNSSSGLMLEDGRGEDGAFWQTLRRHDVDLFLAGEVHDVTAIQRGDGEPLQISHGGYASLGRTDYLLGEVRDDGSITLEAFTIDRLWRSEEPLWQTNRTIVPERIGTATTSRSVGTLVLDPDGAVTERTGCLAEWSGEPDTCTEAP